MSSSRRWFLRISGLAGLGLGIALLGKMFQRQTPAPRLSHRSSPVAPTQPVSPGGELQSLGSSPVASSPPASPTPLGREPNLQIFNFETVTVNAQGQVMQQHSGQAQFYGEDLGNGVTLEMVAIPGGQFWMGSPDTDAQRRESESPRYQVTVPAFWMGKFTVTQAQYQAVMGRNPARFKKQGANRPVEQVSWKDAQGFCQRLSQQTGRAYRLPSEAEWEYACRAGTTTPFHFGETLSTDLANYIDATDAARFQEHYLKQTTAVGRFPPNGFGLYDMHGNIWEWCQDFSHDNYQGAPDDGSAWELENRHGSRSLRGGSWGSYLRNCRSATRNRKDPDSRDGEFGFRVVYTAA